MKLLFLLSWLSLCCATSFAQTLEFSGKITDPENLAILGASVVLKGDDRILVFAYSDDAGLYAIDVEKGDFLECFSWQSVDQCSVCTSSCWSPVTTSLRHNFTPSLPQVSFSYCCLHFKLTPDSSFWSRFASTKQAYS